MRPYEIVVSIPHASTFIPDEIRSRMPHADEVLNSEPDLYTDQIYTIPSVRIVEAKVSRIVSDVNRAPDEIYTSGPKRANSVVILSLSNGQDVFEKDPTPELMEEWIRTYHDPFHEEIDRALVGARFLIDCHSMWSVSPPSRADVGKKRPDVVLGNRLYTTCDVQTMKFFRDAFRDFGYDVAINDPFIGRYVVGTHCSRKTIPGLQIEFNRALYMDEDSLEPHDHLIQKLNGEFQELVDAFCAWDETRDHTRHVCDLSA